MNHRLIQAAKSLALAGVLACGSSYCSAAEPAVAAAPTDSVVRTALPSDMPAIGMISPQENDRRIARWLSIDNNMVLECAKTGVSKAKSPAVKNLAETLVAHHEKCAAELKDAVSKKGDVSVRTEAANDSAEAKAREEKKAAENRNKPALADTTPDRSRTAVLVQDEGRTRDARNLFTPTDFLSIQEKVAADMQSFAKKQIDAIPESEFDKAFIHHQIMAHECCLANAKAVRSNASAEMQASIDKGVEKLNAHLEAIRNVGKQINALPN